MSEPNKSKYRRDQGEKKSKYIKDKNEKSYSSKYVRTDEQKEAFKERQKSRKDEKPLSAKERYEYYLERERLRNIALEGEIFDGEKPLEVAEEVKEPEAVEEVNAPEEPEQEEREYIRAKGTSTDIFKEREANVQDFFNYVEAEAQPEKKLQKVIFVRLAWTAVLLALSIVLQIRALRFHIPFTPQFLTIDFSLFPSLFAAIAYGPLTGVLISVIKNALFVVLDFTSIGTAASSVILDTVFLTLASILYMRGMFSKTRYEQELIMQKQMGTLKDRRTSRVFISGFISSIVTAFVSIFTYNYILYPIVFKFFGDSGFTREYVIKTYDSALEGMHRLLPITQELIPNIDSTLKGVIVYNVPANFAKLVVVTLLTAILYKPLSRFLHYRPKPPKKK